MEDKNFEVVDRNFASVEANKSVNDDRKIKLTESSRNNMDSIRSLNMKTMDITEPETNVNQNFESSVEDKNNDIEMSSVASLGLGNRVEESRYEKANRPIRLEESMKDNVEDKYRQSVELDVNSDIDVNKVNTEEITKEVENNFIAQSNVNVEETAAEDVSKVEEPEIESKFDELVAGANNEYKTSEYNNKDVSFELDNKETTNENDDFAGFNFSIPESAIVDPDQSIQSITDSSKEIEDAEEEKEVEGTINDGISSEFKQVDEDYNKVELASNNDFYNVTVVEDLEQLRQALRQEKEKKEALTKQLAEEQIAAEEANKDLQKAEETKITVLNLYKESLERYRRENEKLQSQSDKVAQETNQTNSEIKATMDYVSSLNEMMNEIVGTDNISSEKTGSKVA